MKRKALLSNWERKALKNNTLDRRLKHKIQGRLFIALDALEEDIWKIAESDHLLSFNIQNLLKWWKLRTAADSAYESLRHKAQEIEIKIETLDFVMKQSVPHYYIRNTERVSYKDGRLIGLFHLEADEDEKAMRDIAYRHIDRQSELRIELSLRRIKAPYPRRILKKALKYGYKFPTTLKKAVPLSSIRVWILSKEPTM